MRVVALWKRKNALAVTRFLIRVVLGYMSLWGCWFMEAAVARWKAPVAHAPDTIITVSGDGEILFSNRVADGYNVEEVIGSSICWYAPAAHREMLRQSLERFFSTGYAAPLEGERAGPKGALAWYSSLIGPIIHGGHVVAATIITTDITKRGSCWNMKYRAGVIGATLEFSREPYRGTMLTCRFI